MSKYLFGKLWVVFAVVALLALAGCSAAKPAADVNSGAKKVVTFDGGSVTKGELQKQLDRFAQQSGAGKLKPGSPQYDAAIQQVMPQAVGFEIAKAYAKENNITVSDKGRKQGDREDQRPDLQASPAGGRENYQPG